MFGWRRCLQEHGSLLRKLGACVWVSHDVQFVQTQIISASRFWLSAELSLIQMNITNNFFFPDNYKSNEFLLSQNVSKISCIQTCTELQIIWHYTEELDGDASVRSRAASASRQNSSTVETAHSDTLVPGPTHHYIPTFIQGNTAVTPEPSCCSSAADRPCVNNRRPRDECQSNTEWFN